MAFTGDGHWLATAGSDLGLALWPLTNPYYRILPGHEGGVFEAVFAPDGSHLLTQGRNDGIVLSWDLSAGASHFRQQRWQTVGQRVNRFNLETAVAQVVGKFTTDQTTTND